MQQYKQIPGGVCAAAGFTAAGIYCGIRKNKNRKDLAMIYADTLCSAAAVYTQNKVCGAPVTVTKQHLTNGKAQAVIVNSGNANTCNADGIEKAKQMCKSAAQQLQIQEQDVIVASTGVIGVPLPIEAITGAMEELTAGLSIQGAADAANAILTTDLVAKEIALEFEIDGCKCHIGGMSKGSGMIHPNMATMLAFLTTDVAISPAMLQQALKESVDVSYNMISVDGDTSTNDMCCILASSLAGNKEITAQGKEYNIFLQALKELNIYLAKQMAADGEGATKLVQCHVQGAKDSKQAKILAKSVICSSLVKAAMFGADANWGRILCALGYSSCEPDVSNVDVCFTSSAGSIEVCKASAGVAFSEEKAKEILLQKQVNIEVDMHQADGEATAWGCDLTYDYVKINGDYRT